MCDPDTGTFTTVSLPLQLASGNVSYLDASIVRSSRASICHGLTEWTDILHLLSLPACRQADEEPVGAGRPGYGRPHLGTRCR